MSRNDRWNGRRLRSAGAGIAAVASAFVAVGAAQDGRPPVEAVEAQPIEEFRRAAEEYAIVLESSPTRRLTLADEPALVWTNPLRETDAGAVFLWLGEGGRPEVAASFYRVREGGEVLEEHEFQSLATVGLAATRAGLPIWEPDEGGVELRPVPGAPAPAASMSQRPLQARALARRFRAFIDTPTNRSELRMLPRPLARFGDGGALFAFVQATDPEVLLLIEARDVDGAPAWHYGLARMSLVDLRAELDDATVWRVPWLHRVSLPGEPYITIQDADRSR